MQCITQVTGSISTTCLHRKHDFYVCVGFSMAQCVWGRTAIYWLNYKKTCALHLSHLVLGKCVVCVCVCGCVLTAIQLQCPKKVARPFFILVQRFETEIFSKNILFIFIYLADGS